MPTCPTCRAILADGAGACPNCPRSGSEIPATAHADRNPHEAVTLLEEESFTSSDGSLPRGAKVGDYVVDACVAEGGFGTVYRVTHPIIGKSAAVKVLKREYSKSPEMVSRFIAEARAVNQIRHKNIVDIFAFGVLEDGRHYFVMELLEGVTLDAWVKTRGPMPAAQALPILRQLGRALAAAHAAGITHRDLKPENVLLVFDEDGAATPKLLDFGIAKLRDGRGESKHKTQSGTPMGTPLYMSPEQVYGQETDHRTDIYSLGVLVHELLTGEPPFDGSSVMEVLTAQATKPAPPMSSCAAVPSELDAPVLHMLEKEPVARPQSVIAALDELSVAAEKAGLAGVSRQTGDVSIAIPRSAASSRKNDDLAAARTLAGGTHVTANEPSTSGRRVAVVAGGLLVLAVAAGLVATVHKNGDAPAATPASATASAAPSATASTLPTQSGSAPQVVAIPGSSVAPAASVVKLTIEGAPEGTDVLVAGKKVGTVGAPIEVPRGEDEVKLSLKKTGYATKEIAIVPDRDQTLTTSLSRSATAPAKPKSNRDLEF